LNSTSAEVEEVELAVELVIEEAMGIDKAVRLENRNQ